MFVPLIMDHDLVKDVERERFESENASPLSGCLTDDDGERPRMCPSASSLLVLVERDQEGEAKHPGNVEQLMHLLGCICLCRIAY